jgi:hemoglobin
MATIKTDLLSPADVTKLIKTFYDRLLTSSIKHHFINLNLEAHLPRIESFWNAALFPDHAYSQNLMERHAQLQLQEEDFKIWLHHFWETIDSLYSGANADLLKNRAASISYIMQKKLIKH